MENTNTENFNQPVSKPSGTKVALINGIYMGLALIILSLIFYLLDVPRDSWVQYTSYLVMIVLTFIFIKQWRDQYNGGYISYGGAFGHGFLVILFGSIISAIYTFIFFNFIAPGELAVMVEEAEQQLYDRGMSDQEIEVTMQWTRMMMKPWMMAIWVTVGGAVAGLIISAILSVFLKKEPKEF